MGFVSHLLDMLSATLAERERGDVRHIAVALSVYDATLVVHAGAGDDSGSGISDTSVAPSTTML